MANISNYLISNRFFQKIIDTLPVLLFWTDLNDVIIGNNLPHAKAFGFSTSEELIGKSTEALLREKLHLSQTIIDRVLKHHAEIVETKKGKIIEYTAVLNDGKNHTHLSLKEPLFNDIYPSPIEMQKESVFF